MAVDEELAGQIKASLMQDGRLSALPIKVVVSSNIVMLEGVVCSYRRKLAAQEIASSFSRGRDVVNRLKVEPPSPISDAEVANLIRAALDAHADITREAITVSVAAGEATLAGRVSSRWERLIAQDVTLSVRGVRSVQNLLIVDLPEHLEDEALAREIQAALRDTPDLRDAAVRVAVNGGVAVLSGDVRTALQKEAAEAALRQFRPIHVRNEILVKQAR